MTKSACEMEIKYFLFPYLKGSCQCPNMSNKPLDSLPLLPTTTDWFSVQIYLLFDKCMFSNYHIMSFLPMSLHNKLIAQQTTVEKYLMDTYNFKTVLNYPRQRRSERNILWNYI